MLSCKIDLRTLTSYLHNWKKRHLLRPSLRRDYNGVFQLQSSFRISLQRLEIDNQRFFDCEYRVVLEVLIVLVEDLGCNWFVAVTLGLVPLDMSRTDEGIAYDEMDVRWSEWMSIQHL